MFLEENNFGLYLNELGMCDNSELIQSNVWIDSKQCSCVFLWTDQLHMCGYHL